MDEEALADLAAVEADGQCCGFGPGEAERGEGAEADGVGRYAALLLQRADVHIGEKAIAAEPLAETGIERMVAKPRAVASSVQERRHAGVGAGDHGLADHGQSQPRAARKVSP